MLPSTVRPHSGAVSRGTGGGERSLEVLLSTVRPHSGAVGRGAGRGDGPQRWRAFYATKY